MYTDVDIKRDLDELDSKKFYMKYIVKSYNWYFQNVLSIPENKILDINDKFKEIVSRNLNISFNSVMMVGSGKLGYSLSPHKFLKKFVIDPSEQDKSDIDIAIISNDLYQSFWRLFRKEYSVKYSVTYKHVSREIYRGYINERNIREVDKCRVEWNKLCSNSNKELKNELYLRHNISYRIYRRWEDFEEYNVNSLDEIKKRGIN